MEPVCLTVLGTPRTKKTSSIWARTGDRTTGRPIILPAKEWQQWVKQAVIFQQLDMFGESLGKRDWRGSAAKERIYLGLEPLVTERVNCRAHFYLTRAQHGDAVGYYQGLADLLEKRGVLKNDKLIGAWDGSELYVDVQRPRVEIVFTAKPKCENPPEPSDVVVGRRRTDA